MAYAIIPLDYITLLIYVNNSCCFALFCFIVGSDKIEILDEKENNMTRRTKCRTVDFLPETDEEKEILALYNYLGLSIL